MGRQRGRFKRWPLSWPFSRATRTPGASFLPAPNMLKTSSGNQQQDSPHFNTNWVFHPLLSPCSGEPSDVPSVIHWFQENERVWDEAHHHLQQAVWWHKEHADARWNITPIYQPEQLVWLLTWDIQLCLPWSKLSPKWICPFQVIKQVNPVTYELKLPTHYHVYPTFHVSLFKPHHPPVSVPSTEPANHVLHYLCVYSRSV